MQNQQQGQEGEDKKITSTTSKFIEASDEDVKGQFRNALFTEIAKLDDSIKEEEKDRWYRRSLELFVDVTKINLFLLASAFIIDFRIKSDEKKARRKAMEEGEEYSISKEQQRQTLVGLLDLYSSKYRPKASATMANVTTDIYKYYKRVTIDR